MRHTRLFPLLFLLLSILDISSSLSFNFHFSQWAYDPQEIIFNEISLKNNSFHGNESCKKRKNFLPSKPCDCKSRFDGLTYARPVLLRDEATDEVASFKMTLCLKLDRRQAGISSSSNVGDLMGMFTFMVPYSGKGLKLWPPNDSCMETDPSSSLGIDPVVCYYVRYDSAAELFVTRLPIGDGSCDSGGIVDRRLVPKEAVVGLASRTAGDPIKLENILLWSFHSWFHSTLESKDPPLSQPPHAPNGGGGGARGEQRLRLDPWNGNAELNIRYQRIWQQLRCSVSVTVGYGNANGDTD